MIFFMYSWIFEILITNLHEFISVCLYLYKYMSRVYAWTIQSQCAIQFNNVLAAESGFISFVKHIYYIFNFIGIIQAQYNKHGISQFYLVYLKNFGNQYYYSHKMQV